MPTKWPAVSCTMKYGIMCKNKLLWFDLLVCTLWLWVVLGGRYTWSSPVELIALVAVFLRITTAFLLRKSEIRAWLPLGIMSGCLGLLWESVFFPDWTYWYAIRSS